jgi:hypothetical protein
MLVNIVVKNTSANVYLDKITPRIAVELRKEITHQATQMANLMKTRFLSGGGSYSLASRTGTLRKSLGVITAVGGSRSQSVVGGIHIGQGIPYARVHINTANTVTTIHAKGKFLTIPARGGPALTAGGVKKRASALDWPNLAYINTNSGPAFVSGRRVPAGRKRQGPKRPVPIKVGGAYQVYYWLRKSVRVRARVDPAWIVKLSERNIYTGIKDAIARATKP